MADRDELIGFLRSLFRDEAARASFRDHPRDYLAVRGFGQLAPDEVREAAAAAARGTAVDPGALTAPAPVEGGSEPADDLDGAIDQISHALTVVEPSLLAADDAGGGGPVTLDGVIGDPGEQPSDELDFGLAEMVDHIAGEVDESMDEIGMPFEPGGPELSEKDLIGATTRGDMIEIGEDFEEGDYVAGGLGVVDMIGTTIGNTVDFAGDVAGEVAGA